MRAALIAAALLIAAPANGETHCLVEWVDVFSRDLSLDASAVAKRALGICKDAIRGDAIAKFQRKRIPLDPAAIVREQMRVEREMLPLLIEWTDHDRRLDISDLREAHAAIKRLEAAKAGAPPSDMSAYDMAIERWERIIEKRR